LPPDSDLFCTAGLEVSKKICKAHNISERPAEYEQQGLGRGIKQARKLGCFYTLMCWGHT